VARISDRRRSSVKKEERRGPTHRPSVWAGALSVFLLLAIIALRVYGDYLYDYPPNPGIADLPQSNTAIVVLAGGKHRIETAYELFADGVGDRLFVVGAGRKSTVMSIARIQGVEVAQKIPWDRFDKIHVETESRNTIENAYAVKRIVQQNPRLTTLILLTSSYHMRRAQFMIAYHLPPEVRVIPYTPANEQIVRTNWWHTWLGIQVTIQEYFKYLVARVLLPIIGNF